MSHVTTIRLLRAALALLCTVLPLTGQEVRSARTDLEQAHLAEVRARYAADAWARGPARAGLSTALELEGFEAGVLDADQGLLTRDFRHAGGNGTEPSFVLESHVCDDALAAQAELVQWLAGVQSAARMPALAELGLSIGDVGFAGRSGAGHAALAWIAFARGNVAVRVSAFDALREPELDLGAIAGAVDHEILRSPELAAGALPARPSVRALRPLRRTVVAGAVVGLDLEVVDPRGQAPHLRWLVGGRGQGYVERAGDGRWELHTTGAGEIQVTLEVTASNGTWSRQTIPLQVLAQ